MVAVIPLVIAGVIGLILIARAGDIFKSSERRAEEDSKGSVGAAVDDALGEGAAAGGAARVAANTVGGEGTFEAVNNAGLGILLAGYNFASDPFNSRPDLTVSQVNAFRRGIIQGGGDPSEYSYEEIHDTVSPRQASGATTEVDRPTGRRGA